ncbi:kinase-like protein, partial [Coprinopsis marcescibilis]
LYAAKCHYNVGSGPHVSSEENQQHLKEELHRQSVVREAVNRFIENAKSLKVSVYDIKVADAFLFIVSDGMRKGHSWLVDPLVEGGKFRKFSGTNEAGSNGADLAGRTCDAFAHFSYFDSQGTVVFVDLQGWFPFKRTSSHYLTLYDTMIHSSQVLFGLGDQGQLGVDEFVSQHTCNSICRALGLTDVTEMSLKFSSGPDPDDKDK